jgi:CubicO group peptidase (beta-lactamase class C family)
MTRTVLLLATLLVLARPLAAQNGSAGHGTLSPDRLARIDQWFERYVAEERIAGAVALVLQDGRPVYEKAFGWRDREARQPMTTDALFRIASQTKALTSAAILALAEEGRLGVTDPVSRFIPEFAHTTVAVRAESGVSVVPASRQITIRDLLTHTAGISYGVQAHVAALYEAKGLGPAAGLGWYTADKDEPICTTMERLASVPFVSQPGERYVYGYNTDVLGCVVERASGMPLDQFIRTRITEPLGMRDTFFYVPTDQAGRLATVYASGPDGRVVRAPDGPRGQGHYVNGPRRSFAGGAGLISTARDYARFLEMIRNGGALGNARILSPRSVKLMTTDQAGELYQVEGRGFGYGFETTDRFGANGLESAGAFGWGGAYASMYRVDPTARLVIVMMTQLLPNATDVRSVFPTLVYQALLDGGT